MKKKRVGDYELLDTLGSGTFGKVRRARHIITEKEYAVKCIDKTMLEKQKMRTQLKREISIAKLIQHPRVVQLFEVLASKTKIYLVLELVTGGELFDLLAKEKVFGEVKARHFFKQLVDGMICCHEKGICHRDVKPENLLLDSNGDLKISDFGLSGLHDCNCGDATLTQSKMLYTTCGTPYYVSPEVIEGKGYDGRRADIWSMGVVLFVMTTGTLPFRATALPDLFSIIREGKYKNLPSGVSPSFSDLISKILVIDPSKRLLLREIQQHDWMRTPSHQLQTPTNRSLLS